MVSIVMTAYKRAHLLEKTLESIARQQFKDYEVVVVEDDYDNGLTEAVAKRFGARYFCRRHRPGLQYSNPAIPCNIGIRQAVGDIIILQNAECLHASEELIERLSSRVTADNAVMAATRCMEKDGTPGEWYIHSRYNRRPFFFCGAIKRQHLLDIRGFDEDFIYYGWDDDDLATRLKMKRVRFEWADDIIVQHQWHPPSFNNDYRNAKIYEDKLRDMNRGLIGIVRNLNREWGVLE